jgi:flavodoxin
MKPIRGLVVFYSRSGTTRRVARAVAGARGWDLEELVDLRARAGFFGYLRSVLDSLRQHETLLKPPTRDPAQYDVVIVGTPAWNGHVASAVRTYLKAQRRWMPRVAFFATFARRWEEGVFRELTTLCGKAPVDTLAVTVAESASGSALPRIEAFVDACTATGDERVSEAIGAIRRRSPAQGTPNPLILRHTAAP